MKTEMHLRKPAYGFLPIDIEGFDSLLELALDIRWSWDHSADEIWQKLDAQLWDLTQNPLVVLQTVSRDQFKTLMGDPAFRENINAVLKSRKENNASPAWFQKNYPNSSLNCVAYFSMEFMLSEALPIYSGGLGNVAGDQLKTASDLGLPVIGMPPLSTRLLPSGDRQQRSTTSTFPIQ